MKPVLLCIDAESATISSTRIKRGQHQMFVFVPTISGCRLIFDLLTGYGPQTVQALVPWIGQKYRLAVEPYGGLRKR